MKRETVIQKIKTVLGSPVIDVYVTDNMISTYLDITMDKLASSVYKSEFITLPVARKQNLLDRDVAIVVNVVEDNPAYHEKENIYTRSDFNLYEAQYFYNNLENNMVTPILAKMLRNQIDNAFGSKFDWFYDYTSGDLYVDNITDGTTALTAHIKTYFTLETLNRFLDSWVYNHTLGLVMQAEGKIRSKYADSVPGAPTDGASLIQEGTALIETAGVEIDNYVSLDIGGRL